jgi:hypothetical protein
MTRSVMQSSLRTTEYESQPVLRADRGEFSTTIKTTTSTYNINISAATFLIATLLYIVGRIGGLRLAARTKTSNDDNEKRHMIGDSRPTTDLQVPNLEECCPIEVRVKQRKARVEQSKIRRRRPPPCQEDNIPHHSVAIMGTTTTRTVPRSFQGVRLSVE